MCECYASFKGEGLPVLAARGVIGPVSRWSPWSHKHFKTFRPAASSWGVCTKKEKSSPTLAHLYGDCFGPCFGQGLASDPVI